MSIRYQVLTKQTNMVGVKRNKTEKVQFEQKEMNLNYLANSKTKKRPDVLRMKTVSN